VQNVRLKNRLESVEVALKGENEQLRGQFAEQKQSNEQLGEKVKELDRQLGQMQELDQTVAALPPAPQFETIQEVLDPRTAGQASGSEGGEPQPKRMNVPAGTGIVILKLRFEDGEYKSYRAVVKRAGGEEVWNQSSLRAKEAGSGSHVQLRLPAGRLSEGKHLITLSGLDLEKEYKIVGRYSFEIVKGK
jgi:hypothetical protein